MVEEHFDHEQTHMTFSQIIWSHFVFLSRYLFIHEVFTDLSHVAKDMKLQYILMNIMGREIKSHGEP